MKSMVSQNISRYPSTDEVEERRRALAEIERLREMVGSLAEDLRIALGIIERPSEEVPRVWIRALKQNLETAEQEIAASEAIDDFDEKSLEKRVSLPVERNKRRRVNSKKASDKR